MLEKYTLLLVSIIVCGINIIIWAVTKKTLLLLFAIGLYITIVLIINSIIKDKSNRD